MASGKHVWHDSAPASWEAEVARFYRGLAEFDARLSSDEGLGFATERIFQGPIADALTHVGQINMLRSEAGGRRLGAKIISGRRLWPEGSGRSRQRSVWNSNESA